MYLINAITDYLPRITRYVIIDGSDKPRPT